MQRVRRKVMIQVTVFMKNKGRFCYHFPKYNMKFCQEILMQNCGKRIFSNRQLGMTVHIGIVMIMVLDLQTLKQKNLAVKNTVFLHRNSSQYTRTSPDVKTHNLIDQILIDRRWNSNVLDVQSLRGSDCDTNLYLQKLGKHQQ